MTVDGGRSLTSKGQTDWYGQLNMNRFYEQDGLSWYSQKAKERLSPFKVENKPRDPEAMFNWV
jgi:hypothetical protein